MWISHIKNSNTFLNSQTAKLKSNSETIQNHTIDDKSKHKTSLGEKDVIYYLNKHDGLGKFKKEKYALYDLDEWI